MLCNHMTFRTQNLLLKAFQLRFKGYTCLANINYNVNKLCDINVKNSRANWNYVKPVLTANVACVRYQSTQPDKTSKIQKLKKAVAEYGSIIIVFHIGISLISLGFFYLLVSLGIDFNQIIDYLGLGEWTKKNEVVSTAVVSNAGTFVVAYGVHKLFAPVRISITLASVPFIVKYLRTLGYLKK